MIITNTTSTRLVYRTKGQKIVLSPGVGVSVGDEKIVEAMKAFYKTRISVLPEPTEIKETIKVTAKETEEFKKVVEQIISRGNENDKEGSEDGEEGHDVLKDGTEENTDGEGPVLDNAPSEGEEANKELGENKKEDETESGTDGNEPSDQQDDTTPEILSITKGKSKKTKSQTKKAKNAKSSK